MKRWGVRMLVAGTVLVCLVVGGYAGQVWWAKQIATDAYEHLDGALAGECFPTVEDWRGTAWWGAWCGFERGHIWVPRRAYYEFMKLNYRKDLGNDPDAWKAWFQSNPTLVWEGMRTRSAEPQPGTADR